jgi:hypothetical protein
MFQTGSSQLQVMFQAGSRQAPGYVPGRMESGFSGYVPGRMKSDFSGYVPGRIKVGSNLCSKQDQGRFQFMFQAGSRQVPVYVPGRIKAYSEPLPGWLKPFPGWLEPIPGWLEPIPGYWTLFLAGSHVYSGTHTVPKCVHVHTVL